MLELVELVEDQTLNIDILVITVWLWSTLFCLQQPSKDDSLYTLPCAFLAFRNIRVDVPLISRIIGVNLQSTLPNMLKNTDSMIMLSWFYMIL